MAGHVNNPATKFEDPTNIRPWVTSYNVSHWLPLKMYLKCVRRPFCLMQIIRWKLKIRLGNRAHWIQHAWIMLKSLVPHFYPKMQLTCTILRNASRLDQLITPPAVRAVGLYRNRSAVLGGCRTNNLTRIFMFTLLYQLSWTWNEQKTQVETMRTLSIDFQ